MFWAENLWIVHIEINAWSLLIVQKRAINMISNLQSVSYEDKIKEVGIQTLEARRTQTEIYFQ